MHHLHLTGWLLFYPQSFFPFGYTGLQTVTMCSYLWPFLETALHFLTRSISANLQILYIMWNTRSTISTAIRRSKKNKNKNKNLHHFVACLLLYRQDLIMPSCCLLVENPMEALRSKSDQKIWWSIVLNSFPSYIYDLRTEGTKFGQDHSVWVTFFFPFVKTEKTEKWEKKVQQVKKEVYHYTCSN